MIRIDLLKLLKYIMKRVWLLILCAAICFGGMYYYVTYRTTDVYAAYATMYVYNGNPNVINYQYVNTNDLSSAVQLLDTYMVVVKSNKVLDSVAERLNDKYPGITADFIRLTLSMGSVSETGVLQVVSKTVNAELSADICNAVLDVAPSEIIRVVSAGNVEIVDYAEVPQAPLSRGLLKKGILAAMAGAVMACGLLVLLFLLNMKITEGKDLESTYTPPLLASVIRSKKEEKRPDMYLLDESSPMEKLESYAKLRMNLIFTLIDKRNNAVVVTSAISGEGKSTITANLAVSCARSGRRVLLIDADMRRACQYGIFGCDTNNAGLSEILIGQENWHDCVTRTRWNTLDILPAGQLPPNPAELLSSLSMKKLLDEVNAQYDLVLIDVPPINIVTDPLLLSDLVAGCLFVTRQNYSDHREIRRALASAEMANMNVLGFVFYGEKLYTDKYYSQKHYKNYYNKYDNRTRRNHTGA